MWELDHKEGWVPKNWYFQTVVLEKTLESPLDSKEIKAVNPKENQPWIFTGRAVAEAEAPVLWPPDAKSQLIGKASDTGKYWGWEEKRRGWQRMKMAGWHHWHEFEQILGDSEGSVVQGITERGHDLKTEQELIQVTASHWVEFPVLCSGDKKIYLIAIVRIKGVCMGPWRHKSRKYHWWSTLRKAETPLGSPGGSEVKNLPARVGGVDLTPGPGESHVL